MRAVAVKPAQRTVEIISQPEPATLGPTEVELAILDVGICGTDREICAFEYGTPPPGSDHLVIGHESLGEVVRVGSAVDRVKPGDLVVPMVRRPCRILSCRACQEGRQDYCFTGEFTERGINGAHGFMTERVVDDQQYMNPVPRELRDVAVLVEPLTIAEKGMAQVWNVQARLPWGCPVGLGLGPASCHRAVVLGAGPVGLLGAMKLCASGFETFVYAREAGPSPRTAFCGAIGATYLSAQDVSLSELAGRVGNIDLVFEATGASRLSFDMMRFLGANAVFVLTGVPGRRGPVEVDTDLVMRNLVLKNQILFGTVNAGREDFEAAIRDLGEFARRWPGPLASLITGRHGLEDAPGLLAGVAPTSIKEVLQLEPRMGS
jgi:threonine dehydrogenase-like Zn-dependent dehydrogenase